MGSGAFMYTLCVCVCVCVFACGCVCVCVCACIAATHPSSVVLIGAVAPPTPPIGFYVMVHLWRNMVEESRRFGSTNKNITSRQNRIPDYVWAEPTRPAAACPPLTVRRDTCGRIGVTHKRVVSLLNVFFFCLLRKRKKSSYLRKRKCHILHKKWASVGPPLIGATAWHGVGTEAVKSLDVLCRHPRCHTPQNSQELQSAVLGPPTWGKRSNVVGSLRGNDATER